MPITNFQISSYPAALLTPKLHPENLCNFKSPLSPPSSLLLPLPCLLPSSLLRFRPSYPSPSCTPSFLSTQPLSLCFIHPTPVPLIPPYPSFLLSSVLSFQSFLSFSISQSSFPIPIFQPAHSQASSFKVYVSAFGYPYLYYHSRISDPACFIGVDG